MHSSESGRNLELPVALDGSPAQHIEKRLLRHTVASLMTVTLKTEHACMVSRRSLRYRWLTEAKKVACMHVCSGYMENETWRWAYREERVEFVDTRVWVCLVCYYHYCQVEHHPTLDGKQFLV